jgi:hypothetical protein
MRRATKFHVLNEVHVDLGHSGVQIKSLPPRQEEFRLEISCRTLDWQLAPPARVSASFLPFIYMVDPLYIYWTQFLPSQFKATTSAWNGWIFFTHLLL